jgi:hypothetical protein
MQRIILVLLASLFLVSCATQKNIPLTEAYWQQKQNHKIAVALVKPPEPGVIKEGQQGLLDVVINSAMTNSLDKHLRKTDLDWYYTLPKEFMTQLNQRHVNADITDVIDSADKKTYAKIAAQSHSNEILVLRLYSLGAIRKYYAFIPLSAPKAFSAIRGELINVNNMQVIWRHDAIVTLPVDGSWDQPPAYPNLSGKLKLAMNTSRQEILDSFFSGH